jgi:sn-glycerol 3-phosphate transport system permease protein
MIENRPILTFISHLILAIGVAIVALPVYVTFVASTLAAEEVLQSPMPLLPGTRLLENYGTVLQYGASGNVTTAPVGRMMVNSLITALVIAFGKIAISLLSAFAIVYFRFRFRALAFWLIFVTLMLRLTVPLIASATATFLFRQFFLTIPDELAEAARIDGAGPLRFFWDVVIPLSRPNIAALFVILFIYGWNQYLWPLLVTTDESMYTAVIGIKRMIAGGEAATEWNLVMATAMLAMLPPALVVLLMQKWFVKGLVDTEK